MTLLNLPEIDEYELLKTKDDVLSLMRDKREAHQHVRRITLTSAQILALNSTAVTLIIAHALSIIVVEGIAARLNFNSTAYEGTNNLEFRYTNASGAKITADLSSTFLNSSSTAYRHVLGIEAELTPVINSAIVVTVPVANPTTGNSTLDLVIKYRVVTF